MSPLPKIMVAPNGARLTPADHPALPITIDEVVKTTRACAGAGADGLHAHVRDGAGRHVLDVGLYRELLKECEVALPGFYVQITTEAVGRYTPEEQRALVEAVRPRAVSIAFREMLPETTSAGDADRTRAFYRDCAAEAIAVQHILCSPDDVTRFARAMEIADGAKEALRVLYALGRYTSDQRSTPDDLGPFLASADEAGLNDADWAVCAFGPDETACLAHAAGLGGKVRVGFENNRLMASGAVAASNAERVAEVRAELGRRR